MRLISLNQSLWLDEATTAIVARDFSWGDFLGKFLPADFHPPLYYVLVKLFAGLINNYSEVAIRTPSVTFGVLTVFLAYRIGKIIDSKRLGLVLAFLLAVSPLHIYYSQEARMYVLTAFFVALSVYFYIKNNYWLFCFSLTAAFWSDYMAVFMIPVFAIHNFFYQRKNLQKTILFLIIALFLCLPMLLFLPNQLSAGLGISSEWANVLGRANIKNFLLIPIKFLIGRISFEDKWVYGFAVFIIGSLAGYLFLCSIKKNKKYNFFYFWLFVPPIFGFFVSLFIPVLSYFRFLFLLPAFYLIVSIGAIKAKKIGFVFIFLFFLLNLFFSFKYLLDTRFHREDWRGFVSYVERNSVPNQKVLFVADSQMEGLRYYSKKVNFSGGISGFSGSEDKIWLMRYVWDIFDKEDILRKKIESSGYNRIGEYNFNGVVVWLYKNENSN